MRLAVSLVLVFAAAACGGDDGDVVAIDARTPDGAVSVIDAPPSTGANVLGQLCDTSTAPCPEGNMCVIITGLGNQTAGYCSPMCTQSGTECATGYTGPATGIPRCALGPPGSSVPTQCAILCTAEGDCPTGLACLPVTGQSASVCARPE